MEQLKIDKVENINVNLDNFIIANIFSNDLKCVYYDYKNKKIFRSNCNEFGIEESKSVYVCNFNEIDNFIKALEKIKKDFSNVIEKMDDLDRASMLV